MEYKNEIKVLLQQAVDVSQKSMQFEKKAMSIAQELGLQGEKRRMRYESAKNHNFINYIVCDSFDTYGIELENEYFDISVPEVANIGGFFESYLEKIEEQYDMLHSIANKLVANNCQHMANHLYSKCRDIICDIKYFRRTILEGEAVKWSPEFIFLHQTTAENIHDEFEKKEKEVGYCY